MFILNYNNGDYTSFYKRNMHDAIHSNHWPGCWSTPKYLIQQVKGAPKHTLFHLHLVSVDQSIQLLIINNHIW